MSHDPLTVDEARALIDLAPRPRDRKADTVTGIAGFGGGIKSNWFTRTRLFGAWSLLLGRPTAFRIGVNRNGTSLGPAPGFDGSPGWIVSCYVVNQGREQRERTA